MSPAFLDMYRPPKLFLSQALILLLFFLALLQGIVKGQLELPLTPLSLPALALLLATILSLAKALDIYGGIEEAFRLLTLILLHLTARSLRSQAQLDRFFACSAVATSFVAVYGLLQAKGIDFIKLEWPFVPVSTLGDTGFAAEYLIATIPLILAAFDLARDPWRRGLLGGSLLYYPDGTGNQTSSSRTLVAGDNGAWNFTSIPIGRRKVTATLSGTTRFIVTSFRPSTSPVRGARGRQRGAPRPNDRAETRKGIGCALSGLRLHQLRLFGVLQAVRAGPRPV